jgi:predicted metallopeptidase
MLEPIFSEEEIKFNRLNLDYIKKNDLRLVFEILMSEPEKRTVADINALARIFLNVMAWNILGRTHQKDQKFFNDISYLQLNVSC